MTLWVAAGPIRTGSRRIYVIDIETQSRLRPTIGILEFSVKRLLYLREVGAGSLVIRRGLQDRPVQLSGAVEAPEPGQAGRRWDRSVGHPSTRPGRIHSGLSSPRSARFSAPWPSCRVLSD